MSGGESISVADILDRFRLNENGEIVYARDMIGGNGTISKREGQLVTINYRARKEMYRVTFSINGQSHQVAAGKIGFALEYGILPPSDCGMQIVVRSSDSRPRDFRSCNLIYQAKSDLHERGMMRVHKYRDEWRAQHKFGTKAKYRTFETQDKAIRFAAIYHRWRVKSAMASFWSRVKAAQP